MSSGSVPPTKGTNATAGSGQIKMGRLAGLSLSRAIWVISWPILAQSFLELMVGTVDTSLAAHLGLRETDAIATSAYIVWLVGVITMSVAVGATALISRAVGGGNRRRANEMLGQSITLAAMVGVVCGLVFAIASPWIGRPVGLDAEASVLMRNYLATLSLGIPAMVVTFVGFSCLRGAGESRSPLWVMLVENMVNIPLSILLSGAPLSATIGGHTYTVQGPDSLAMGVTGIAVGTVAARIIGMIIVLWLLARGNSAMRLHWHRLRPKMSGMRTLMKIGLPNLWESLGMWMGNFVIILIIGRVLTQAVADSAGLIGSHQLAIRVEAFAFMPGFAMGTAAATLMGQYLGAGNVYHAKRSALICAGGAAVFMGLLGALFIFEGEWLTSLLSDQEMHMELVPPILRLAGYVQIPFAALLVFRNGLRGVGDTKVAMYLTWIGIYGVRVPGCLIVALVWPEHGLYALWLVMVWELGLRSVMFSARFFQGGWAKLEV